MNWTNRQTASDSVDQVTPQTRRRCSTFARSIAPLAAVWVVSTVRLSGRKGLVLGALLMTGPARLEELPDQGA